MDNKIGQIIKYYRLQANMTQAQLAEGLISVSSLSKIENGNQIPPKDITKLLGERLNIPMEVMNRSKDKDDKLIESWIECLLVEDIEGAKSTYVNYIANVITDSSLYIPIELHKFRYFLLLNDVHQAMQQYQHLFMQSKKFSEMELYYWYKYSAIYWDIQEYHPRALNIFLKAEQCINEYIFEEQKERNDLYYRIAKAALASRDMHKAFHYNEQALELFRSRYLLQECSESHLLFATYFRQMKDYNEAWKCTQIAEGIAAKINCPTLLAKCNESYGSIKVGQDQWQTGMDYFIKSYELCIHCEMEQKIELILKMIKAYYIQNKHVDAKKWVEEVIMFVEQYYGEQINKQVLKVKMMAHQIKETDSHTIEAFITDTIVPYLQERSLWCELHLYLRQLADIYYEHQEFQLSAYYYQESNKYI